MNGPLLCMARLTTVGRSNSWLEGLSVVFFDVTNTYGLSRTDWDLAVMTSASLWHLVRDNSVPVRTAINVVKRSKKNVTVVSPQKNERHSETTHTTSCKKQLRSRRVNWLPVGKQTKHAHIKKEKRSLWVESSPPPQLLLASSELASIQHLVEDADSSNYAPSFVGCDL